MLAAYLATCVLFAGAFALLGVVGRTMTMFAAMRGSFAVMRDPAMDDLAKEKAIQKGSVELLGHLVAVVAMLALAFGVAAVPALIGSWAGLFTFDEFVAFTLRPDVLIATIAVFTGLAFVVRKRRMQA
ncbi:hypothetical protein [Croceicoccus sediminis]|uniref:hypothetical protein n=1 Tax=Croceicoccus sediminis TaxID=2571150 RepID=UPI001182E547|nr:hypothetical protein [Croceicoccus sediminis]